MIRSSKWFKTNDVIISEISKYNKLLKEIRKNEELRFKRNRAKCSWLYC